MPSRPASLSLKSVCPEGWQVLPLAEVAYFQEGPGILAKDFRKVGVPLLRLKGVEGDYVTLDGCNYLDPEAVARKWNHFRVEVGDLLISTSASLGRVSVVTAESAGGVPYTGLIRFKPKDSRLLTGYLKVFLGSAAFVEQAEAMASGSVIRHFGPSHIRQMAILLPPVDQQVQIGQLASLLDERLRVLRQTNATLESIAQALFTSWFIDFDPVRAKAEGREPEGMDAATAALFPAEFEESALGLIPRGWTVGTVDELFVLQRGFDLPASQRTEGKYTVFAASGPHGTHAKAMASGPGVVTGRSGVIGKVFFAHDDYWPLNTALWVKEFKRASPAFAFQFLQSMDLNCLNAGSAVPSLNRNHVHAQQAVIPPAELISAFTAVVTALLQRIRANDDHTKQLAAVRNVLLPRFISGKLRLPEAQEQLEDALA